VIVWDVGTWEPQGDAHAMVAKGDLKFILRGEKLKGSFVLARMRSRRPGSKGTEWLLIKHRDDEVVSGYDINQYDYSVITRRTLDQIAGDEGSNEWTSSRPAAKSPGKTWLAGAIAKADKKKVKSNAEAAGKKQNIRNKSNAENVQVAPAEISSKSKKTNNSSARYAVKVSSASSALKVLEKTPGARKAPMPSTIHPMLATLVDKPFDNADWLFEIKWDGYRSVAFLDGGKARLVSRNQNEMTSQYPELRDLPEYVRARTAILDGEIVALDDSGRPSFSLMQQRTGISGNGRRVKASDRTVPIAYYVFDLLYLDGCDLTRVDLEKRKELLAGIIAGSGLVRYSDHHLEQGTALYEAAKQQGLEGIVAKRRISCYEQKRSREWLKMKITRQQECVIGGYTDPRGSREHFGSIVLGLYDEKERLLHVGQAGSGFTEKTHEDMWRLLQKLKADKNPFANKVESTRRTHWVKPELVAEIKFSEWTHETDGGGVKMRAPVYQGLRTDKSPRECVFERPVPEEAVVGKG